MMACATALLILTACGGGGCDEACEREQLPAPRPVCQIDPRKC